MNRAKNLGIAVAVLTLVAVAPAQTSILWNNPVPVSGPGDVSTSGVAGIALNCGPTTVQVTLNGVTFLPDPTPGNFQIQPPVTANGYTLTMPYDRTASANFWSDPTPGGSAALGQALDKGRHASASASNVMCTVSGLTVGDFYEIQIWSTDDRGGPGWRVSKWADNCGATAVSMSGHSVTGIFSATSTAQSFCNGPQGGNSYNLINMIQIRNLSAAPEYHTNASPAASLDINGVQGTSQIEAVVTVPVGMTGTLGLGSVNVGQPWDLAAGTAPLIPASAGALISSDGQIVNINLGDPSLTLWFNFMQGPAWGTGTALSIPFSFPSATTLSAQMIVADPAQTSGIALSQPVRLLVQ